MTWRRPSISPTASSCWRPAPGRSIPCGLSGLPPALERTQQLKRSPGFLAMEGRYWPRIRATSALQSDFDALHRFTGQIIAAQRPEAAPTPLVSARRGNAAQATICLKVVIRPQFGVLRSRQGLESCGCWRWQGSRCLASNNRVPPRRSDSPPGPPHHRTGSPARPFGSSMNKDIWPAVWPGVARALTPAATWYSPSVQGPPRRIRPFVVEHAFVEPRRRPHRSRRDARALRSPEDRTAHPRDRSADGRGRRHRYPSR